MSLKLNIVAHVHLIFTPHTHTLTHTHKHTYITHTKTNTYIIFLQYQYTDGQEGFQISSFHFCLSRKIKYRHYQGSIVRPSLRQDEERALWIAREERTSGFI